MDSGRFIARVRELTGFDRDRSELLVRTTLVTLGTRIAPGEADDLAAQLPDMLGACVQHETDASRFPPDEFARRVARIVPLADDQARSAIRAVFTALGEAVSEGEVRHVLTQLGGDYAPLVGAPTGRAAAGA